MANRKEVYEAIDSERDYQDTRWNEDTTVSKNVHSFEDWIMYMEDYIAEAKHLLSRTPRQDADPKVCHIMRKVLALGVSSMEQHGAPRREMEESK